MANRIYQLFICSIQFIEQKDGKVNLVVGLRDDIAGKVAPLGKKLLFQFNGKTSEIGRIDHILELNMKKGECSVAMDVYRKFSEICMAIATKRLDVSRVSIPV